MFVSRESVYTHFELDVIAEPSDGGEAIGSGSYLFGGRAHLSATANENYQFVGWTNQDGDTISSDPEYAHMVARGGQCMAHFIGIESTEESSEENIRVCPNPVSDNLHIIGCSEKSKVFVYNIEGEKMHLNTQVVNEQLDLSTLSSGIYFLRIEENHNTTIIKIVKI
jgi:hypothetical protein